MENITRRRARPSAAAFVDVTLLVLLRCSCSSGVDAFVRPHLHESTRWPTHYQHSTCRTQQFVQSLPSGGGQPLHVAPAAFGSGRDLKGERLHALRRTFGRRAGDEALRSGFYGPEQSHDNLRSAPAGISEAPVSPAVSKGIVTGVEAEVGGFEWLREFGNGKMDIAGLVLSTVLLMTAAAPLGSVRAPCTAL